MLKLWYSSSAHVPISLGVKIISFFFAGLDWVLRRGQMTQYWQYQLQTAPMNDSSWSKSIHWCKLRVGLFFRHTAAASIPNAMLNLNCWYGTNVSKTTPGQGSLVKASRKLLRLSGEEDRRKQSSNVAVCKGKNQYSAPRKGWILQPVQIKQICPLLLREKIYQPWGRN